MARIRSIHPGAPLDEEVATMSMPARLLWVYLPCHADREGRLRDSAFTLKSAVFPGDQVDVEQLLTELAARRMIVRYEVEGRRYIQIRSFVRYQNPHKKEAPSAIPGPPSPSHDGPQGGGNIGAQKRPGPTGESPGITGPGPERDRTGPAIRSGPDLDPVRSGSIARARAEGPSGPVPDLCRLFGTVRNREVGGLEWQAVPGDAAARRAGEMRLQLDGDGDALADVESTMALLFKNAHRREYAKSAEILKSPNYAFAVWCTEFPALREQLRGLTPAKNAARKAVEASDKKLAELRSYEDKAATPEEIAELRSERTRARSA